MDVTEKCPSCGEDMERGWLASGDNIHWCNKPPGVWIRKGDKLTKGSFNPFTIAGNRCKSCQIIRYTRNE